MIFDWLKNLRQELSPRQRSSRSRMWRVRRGVKQLEFQATEALESRVMLAGAIGEVTSFSKITDKSGGFVLDSDEKFGSSVTNLGDLDGDGIEDVAVGARDDADSGNDRGAVYVLFLNSDGTVKTHQKISDTQGGFTGILGFRDSFGSSLASLGDLDGDGIEDLAVGATGDDDGGSNRGAVYVLFLNSDGTVKSHQKISETQGSFTGTLTNNNSFGRSIANLGDLDGDGVTDLAVGASGDNDGGTAHGAVFVLFMNNDGMVKSHQKISETQGGFGVTLEFLDSFGSSLTDMGDLDGDGITDLAVGAFGDDDGGVDHGALYLLFLNSDGTLKSQQKISDTQGNFTGTLVDSARFGRSLTNLGDMDGDGIVDLAVGTTGDDDGGDRRGAVFVLFLNANGTVKSHQKISDTAGNFLAELDDIDYFGSTVTNLGDLDGDGVTDIAVGADFDDDGGSGRGAVYVLFLNTDSTVKSHQKISGTEGGLTITLGTVDKLGSSLTNLGDIDGDDIADMAVGAYLDDDGGNNRGAIYVLLMMADGRVRAHQKISNLTGGFTAALDNDDYFGTSLTNLGDLDGDNVADIAVQARGDDDGGIDRGAVYILFLNSDGTVKSHQKISDTEGAFTSALDDYDSFGSSLTSLDDLDGDGIIDLAAGASGDDDGGTDRGAAYVLFLNTDGTVKSHQKISDTAGGFGALLDNNDYFGNSLTSLGDLNGDGITDLTAGAFGDDDGGNSRGAVYVLFLNADGTVKSHQKISNTLGNFTATLDDDDTFGTSVTGFSDLDGDGVADLIVGADGDDDGGTDRGAVYVLFLNADGTVKSYQKISNTSGNFTATLNDSARLGSSLTKLSDLDGNGIVELAAGAIGALGGAGTGAAYVMNLESVIPPGVVTAERKISDTAGNFTAVLEESAEIGISLSDLGDLDGDGINDIAVGEYGAVESFESAGAFYVLFLNADGTVKSHQEISDTEGNFTATLEYYDSFGSSLANLGDLDGDGVTDLAVGALGDDDGGSGRGAVYVLFLNADGTVKSHQKISDTQGNFTATLDNSDVFGISLANLGDLDGDGTTDIAVGATGDDDGGSTRGAVYVLFLNADGTVKFHQKISDTTGGFTATLDDGDRFGSSVTNVGDLDGDGITELAVGAYLDDDGGDNRGAVYVLFLNANGTVKSHQKISDTAGGFTATLDSHDSFGESVANLGDLDGDGLSDLAVGVTDDDDGGNRHGAVYVLFLNADGTVKSHQKISDTQGNFNATLDDRDYFGGSLANVGDLDGDGLTELAVGTPRDDDGGSNHGAVYILSLQGVPSAPVVTTTSVNGGGANRSGIRELTLSFDQNVTITTLPSAALRLFNHTTGTAIDLSNATLLNNGTTSVSWVLSDGPGGNADVSLPDGRYTAELLASATLGAGGLPLSQNHTFEFHKLGGDLDGDGSVNFNDTVPLSINFGVTGGPIYGPGDGDGDGSVNFNDTVPLSINFGATLTATDLEFGDVPDSTTFPTTLANDGARHVITGNTLFLGTAPDAEADGQPSVDATGDDLNGSADEDGVVVGDLETGTDTAVAVTASVPGAAFLNGWVDFNQDGDWDDAGEQVFADEALSDGINNLNIAVPGGAVIGMTYARFRITESAGYSYFGLAPNGEVEDYQLNVTPGPTPAAITVDGDFSDWNASPAYTDPVDDQHDTDHDQAGDTPAYVDHPDVDILTHKVSHDEENFYFYFEATGEIGRTQIEDLGNGLRAGRYYVIVTIDVDNDDVTGYPLYEGGYYTGTTDTTGYDANGEIEFYNGAFNTGHYLQHGATNDTELEQAFDDQSNGGYVWDPPNTPKTQGPFTPGFVNVLPGSYDYYTQWVYRENDPGFGGNDSVTFVQDRGPVIAGNITYALSADGHQLEMKVPFKGFLEDAEGNPIVGIGDTVDLSFSLEASGELSNESTPANPDGEWASDTAEPVIGYYLSPIPTALDVYVAQADPSYGFTHDDTIDGPGYTAYVMDMTSQTWRDASEVDQPVWEHWVTMIVPDSAVSDTAILFVDGGSNTRPAPTTIGDLDVEAVQMAVDSGLVTIHLPTVPSEPLTFTDEATSRTEDEIIAYTFNKFLNGGDAEWPLLNAMVKSAVAAMDTAQSFDDTLPGVELQEFIVTGASKRGWTTWLTAAADPRVTAIVPFVIDVLNMEPSMMHHMQQYVGVTQEIIGGYSSSVHDYVDLNIMDRLSTPEGQALLEIVDPYEYRGRLSMPKYIVNSAGDEFFVPDSSQFYFDNLVGPKYLRYVPNTGHDLNSDALDKAINFMTLVEAGASLPHLDWTIESSGEIIRANTVETPFEVNLWQATNLSSLDFRFNTFGAQWASSTLTGSGGEYVAQVTPPATGGTAFFVELKYTINGLDLTLTTDVSIVKATSGAPSLTLDPDVVVTPVRERRLPRNRLFRSRSEDDSLQTSLITTVTTSPSTPPVVEQRFKKATDGDDPLSVRRVRRDQASRESDEESVIRDAGKSDFLRSF